MREILFRGKGDKRYNCGDWYYGVPIQCYDGDWQICTDNIKRTVIPETISEYTGLVDKNGVEIFENDIVELDRPWNNKFVVAFQGGCFGILTKCDEDEERAFNTFADEYRFGYESKDLTVVGNIFDNPNF